MTLDKGSDGSKFCCFCATSQIRFAPKYVQAEEQANPKSMSLTQYLPLGQALRETTSCHCTSFVINWNYCLHRSRQKATTPPKHARLNYQNKNCPTVSLSHRQRLHVIIYFLWMRAHDRALWKTSRMIRGARLLKNKHTRGWQRSRDKIVSFKRDNILMGITNYFIF